MRELIKIENRDISGATVQTCNARDLWAFVESKQEFANWIKARIGRYGFVEGEDFTVDKIITQYNQVDRIDYHLTLDAAKEMAMVENNDKGREVRRYFIDCERRVREVLAPAIPQTFPEALRLAADLAEQKVRAEEKVEKLENTVSQIIQTLQDALRPESGELPRQGFQAFREAQASLAKAPASPNPAPQSKLSTFEFEGRTVRKPLTFLTPSLCEIAVQQGVASENGK